MKHAPAHQCNGAAAADTSVLTRIRACHFLPAAPGNSSNGGRGRRRHDNQERILTSLEGAPVSVLSRRNTKAINDSAQVQGGGYVICIPMFSINHVARDQLPGCWAR